MSLSEHIIKRLLKKYNVDIDGENPKILQRLGQLLEKEHHLKELYSKFIPSRLRRRIEEDADAIFLQGEKRFVTVLFVDICSFTKLSEKLNPDSVIILVNRIFEKVLAVTRKYGGTVDKFLGDAALVLFGAVEAHKNDTINALKAAQKIQLEISNMGIDIEEFGTLNVSIGIHSGVVVVGAVGNEERREYTVIGDTVNVAARLREIAKPGEIVVSGNVCQNAAGEFEFTKLGKFELRNRSRPMEAFLLGRHIQRSPIAEIRKKVPFWGREREYEILNTFITKGSSSCKVLVSGIAGIGKTRLIWQWIHSLPKNKFFVLWIEGHQEDKFKYFASIVRLIKGMFDEDFKSESSSRYENFIDWGIEFLSNLKSISEKYPKVLELIKENSNSISESSVDLILNDITAFFKKIFAEYLGTKTLIFVIDDFDCIDDQTKNILEKIKNITSEHPIFFIYITREKKVLNDQVDKVIELSGIGKKNAIKMIDFMKKQFGVRYVSTDLIYEKTGDHPLFIEILMSHLHERAYLIQHETKGLPSSIQEVVQARLNDLSENIRHVLEVCAVLRSEFDEDMIKRLIEKQEINVHDALQDLCSLQYLSFNELRDTYSFKQKLVHDVIYESIVQSKRQNLHRKVAQYMIYKREEYASEQIAYHLEESNSPMDAIYYWEEAAQLENFRFNYDRAIKLYHHCLEILARNSEYHLGEKWKILIKLGQIFYIKNELDTALVYLNEALTVTENREDLLERAETLVKIGDIYVDKGMQIQAIEYYKKASNIFQLLPVQELEIKTSNSMGIVYAQMGQWESAEKAFYDGLKRAEDLGDLQLQGMTNTNLGILYSMKEDWEKAVSAYYSSLHCFEEAGIQEGVAQALHNLGMMNEEMENLDVAEDYYLKSIEISKEIDDFVMLLTSTLNRSHVRFKKGDLKTAEKLCLETLDKLEKNKNPLLLADAYSTLGKIYNAMKKLRKAGCCFILSYKYNQKAGNYLGEGYAAMEYGQNLLERKLNNRAIKYLEKALKIFEQLGNQKEKRKIKQLLEDLT